MARDQSRYSAGARFRKALRSERPLQVVGTVNAYVAMLAERAGFRALYLSGAGVANSSYGLPDLGMTTLDNVLEDVRRIAGATSLPLLADADTGFGPAHMIARSVREFIKAGAAGIHIEDQVAAKRCGHRPGKAIVPLSEMVDRIKAAVDAKTDPDFIIMARTDALAVEGLESALERAEACREAGADMLFPEALTGLQQYRAFRKRAGLPILANMTEFGKTPLFAKRELGAVGVDLILYPLTINRVMNRAAEQALATLRKDGHQRALVEEMQTREELYDVLDYHAYEQKLDALFGKDAGKGADGPGAKTAGGSSAENTGDGQGDAGKPGGPGQTARGGKSGVAKPGAPGSPVRGGLVSGGKPEGRRKRDRSGGKE